MPFSMNFSRESLGGGQIPDGWYTLIFKTFEPKLTNAKDSINLNPVFEIINHSEHEGRRIFDTMNIKGHWAIFDFIHSTGVQVEPGDSPSDFTIPGAWQGKDENPEDPTKWVYVGPLTNKVFEAELGTHEYQGKKSSRIKQYKCAIPDCKERHSTNLVR